MQPMAIHQYFVAKTQQKPIKIRTQCMLINPSETCSDNRRDYFCFYLFTVSVAVDVDVLEPLPVILRLMQTS
jgi:hypothetical protein